MASLCLVLIINCQLDGTYYHHGITSLSGLIYTRLTGVKRPSLHVSDTIPGAWARYRESAHCFLLPECGPSLCMQLPPAPAAASHHDGVQLLTAGQNKSFLP